MLESHEYLWATINNYILTSFLFGTFFWECLVFLNTQKIANKEWLCIFIKKKNE